MLIEHKSDVLSFDVRVHEKETLEVFDDEE